MTSSATLGRRIVVLGADGFIGSAVVRAALRAGSEVIALCTQEPWRLAALRDANLKRIAASDWHERGFAKRIPDLIRGADALVHLGYRPPPSGLDVAGREDHERRVNIAAAEALAHAVGDIPIVFASSADVYGAWQESTVTEETDPTPSTTYGAAKLEAEAALGDRATIMRVSTVYGPWELVPRAVPSFLKACLGRGTAILHGRGRDIKDYVPVAAVADAFLAAADSSPGSAGVFNVSSGIGRSTAEVLDAVVEVVGTTPEVNHVPSPRDPSRLVVSPAKARERLGFDPDAEFTDGIREEAQWLEANRARWK